MFNHVTKAFSKYFRSFEMVGDTDFNNASRILRSYHPVYYKYIIRDLDGSTTFPVHAVASLTRIYSKHCGFSDDFYSFHNSRIHSMGVDSWGHVGILAQILYSVSQFPAFNASSVFGPGIRPLNVTDETHKLLFGQSHFLWKAYPPTVVPGNDGDDSDMPFITALLKSMDPDADAELPTLVPVSEPNPRPTSTTPPAPDTSRVLERQRAVIEHAPASGHTTVSAPEPIAEPVPSTPIRHDTISDASDVPPARPESGWTYPLMFTSITDHFMDSLQRSCKDDLSRYRDTWGPVIFSLLEQTQHKEGKVTLGAFLDPTLVKKADTLRLSNVYGHSVRRFIHLNKDAFDPKLVSASAAVYRDVSNKYKERAPNVRDPRRPRTRLDLSH